MAALKIGVIIGRFQVPTLHEGHLKLFKEVAAASDRVVVLLGVSPVDGYTAEHPLTFAQRQSMITNCPGLSGFYEPLHHINILPLFDQRTNDVWSAQVDSLLKQTYPHDILTLYGGRDSFADSYKGKLPVTRSTFCPIVPVTGTQNRAAIKEENDPAFLRGTIAALQRQFPRVFPTTDIAVLKSDDVLLIQRVDSGHWCFPGGFVDPTDGSFELAARRELREETGLTLEGPLNCVGTFPINDFRYRGSRDKIFTTFYAGVHSWGPVTANPLEVQDYRWVNWLGNEITEIIAEVHRPLLSALRTHLNPALRFYAYSNVVTTNATEFGTCTANVVPDATWTKVQLQDFANKYPSYVTSMITAGVVPQTLFAGINIPSSGKVKV